MRNVENWKPTKFEMHGGNFRASRDPSRVGISSRLIIDLIAREYQDAIPKYCSGKLLDLGCGHVPLYSAYKEIIDENICIDWAESLHQNEFLDVIHDLTKPLPLDSESFDTVVCSDVLEHIPTPAAAIQEISRVLKPGGVLLLNVPFMYWVHEAPYDFHRYTEFALKRLCEISDLDVIQLNPVGGPVDVIADISAKQFKKIRYIGKYLSRLLGLHTDSKSIPLLYFLVAKKRDNGAIN
jgi:SAM-dependent methyltransferase